MRTVFQWRSSKNLSKMGLKNNGQTSKFHRLKENHTQSRRTKEPSYYGNTHRTHTHTHRGQRGGCCITRHQSWKPACHANARLVAARRRPGWAAKLPQKSLSEGLRMCTTDATATGWQRPQAKLGTHVFGRVVRCPLTTPPAKEESAGEKGRWVCFNKDRRRDSLRETDQQSAGTGEERRSLANDQLVSSSRGSSAGRASWPH